VAIARARGLAVPDDLRERVLSCTDTAQSEEWAERAATASSLTEIFSD
jgi:hypothetical protein